MKTTSREVKQRREALKASGHSKADVRRLAGVAERNVYYWYAGKKTSKRIAAAHAALTKNGVVASAQQKQNGRRSAETLAAS